MSGKSPQVQKIVVVCSLTIVAGVFINSWYRTSGLNQDKSLPRSSSNTVPNTDIESKTKSTKCGETDLDFKLSGIETVKSLIGKVSMKFRSRDQVTCLRKNFTKSKTQLTPDETQRKVECIRNWKRDYKEGLGSFWAGNTQYIRHNHHTYLSSDSTVFDIGGNKGEDAEAIVKRYNPGNYVILEPIKTLYSNLVHMFKSNNSVLIYNFGLARKYNKMYVNVVGNGGDATSIFAGNDNGGNCLLRVVNTAHFLLRIGVPCYEVDLITINCEGCEFEIMEELIDSGMITQFRHVQFATHPTLRHLQQPVERYCGIQEKLRRTHIISYQYKWCWESWKRKDLT
ncbi:uncharacterized protein LOC125666896 [Ostrea edulis]|uniref:uncharacterized protein LOC125666896 n=1 Tax=Ostrea edulis TaxID=37623 RepID=UPI00209538A2|nr:uncharacterized protein LOC125666896 [Ostrea edulis]